MSTQGAGNYLQNIRRMSLSIGHAERFGGPCPPRFVAFSYLPTSTSAKILVKA
jgi:hypothetical protein